MKGLLVFCLVLTVISAVPLKERHKKYSTKKFTRQGDAVAPPRKPTIPPIEEVTSEPAALESGSLDSSAPADVPASVDTISTKTVVGSKPFGEGSNPQPLLPSPPVVERVSVSEPSQSPPLLQPVAVPTVPPPPPAVLQPGQPQVLPDPNPQPAAQGPQGSQPIVLAPGTEPVAAPVPTDIPTKKPDEEGEDSSSEEEEEAAARQLPVSPSKDSNKLSKIVVNAYALPTGEVLVPLDVYQKYFHNPQYPSGSGQFRPQPLGIFSRQESDKGTASSSEEENETSAGDSSEEIPIRISSTSVIYQEKVKPAKETSDNPNLEADGEVEEKEKPSSNTSSEPEESPKETEEKPAPAAGSTDTDTEDKSAESEEPSAEVVPDKAQPAPEQQSFFNPPPLAAVQATGHTGEDDEEEAGRYVPYYEDDFYPGPGNYYGLDSEPGFDY